MSRKKKSKKQNKPKEKIALFLCRCGSNIAGVVEIDQLKQKYEEQGLPVVEVDEHLCSEQGIQSLVDAIKETKPDKVVLAGCSPGLHWNLFSDAMREAGLDPGHLHMANIREQASWVHWDHPEDATVKAAAIIDTGLAKVKTSLPIISQQVDISRRVLVLGGGIAGLTAALAVADAGFETVIVEREGFLGGHMAKWDKLFPTADCSICILGPVMTRVARHPNITVMTLSELYYLTGSVGRYEATILQKARYVDLETCTGCNKCIEVCPVEVANEYNSGLGFRKAMVRPSTDTVPLAPYIDMDHCVGCQSCLGVCEPKALRYEDEERTVTQEFGAIILATGFKPYDARLVEELNYGQNPDVITSVELERMMNPDGPSHGIVVSPSDGEPPETIAFVTCVGSRSERLNRPYCSRVCCTAAIKEAVQLKHQLPSSNIYIFYTDIRTFGKGHEELYEAAAKDYNVDFVRGKVGEVVRDPVSGATTVRAEDTLVDRWLDLKVDLVVLMVGMDPDDGNRDLAKLLRIPLDENGFFMEEHPKLRPSSTSSRGVFIAGVSQGPKDIADSVAHAGLAATRAISILSSENLIVDACMPSHDTELCMECKECELHCSPGAIKIVDKKAEINLAACRGCGGCVAACPSGALDIACLTNQQLIEATQIAIRHNPFRPAIVGYLCRWCAYNAADGAGVSRLTYPPNMIPIRVPCTGRLNAQTLITAFAEGADGVALIGCHEQDCHYRSGAATARKRMDSLREVVEEFGIDGQRLYFGSVSASERQEYADQVTEFVNRINELGPLGVEFEDEKCKTKRGIAGATGGKGR